MNPANDKLQALIDTLETKVAFQDEALQKLDDALISQQQQITQLERKYSVLMDQMQKIESSIPEAPEEPPPHY